MRAKHFFAFGFLANSRKASCVLFNSSGSETANNARGGVEKNLRPSRSIINEPLTFVKMLSVILSIVSLTPGGIVKLPFSPQIGGNELARGLVSNKLRPATPATLLFRSSISCSICSSHSSLVKPASSSVEQRASRSNIASHKLATNVGDSITLQMSTLMLSPIF